MVDAYLTHVYLKTFLLANFYQDSYLKRFTKIKMSEYEKLGQFARWLQRNVPLEYLTQIKNKNMNKNRKETQFILNFYCVLLVCVFRVVPSVCFCTGHFVTVP